ncbi:MAG: hypothetical protein QM586_06870 [Xenophilus sp.]
MKTVPFSALLIATVLTGAAVQAQDRVWRCGNEYTNNTADAQRRGCKPVEGGNVTIVRGVRATASSSSTEGGSRAQGGPRVDSAEQRQRDSDARAVLETELKKAQARQAELTKEYNNGEPEKQGSEARNYQKYLDRVADMKAQIDRTQSDIDGLERELSRLPASP